MYLNLTMCIVANVCYSLSVLFLLLDRLMVVTFTLTPFRQKAALVLNVGCQLGLSTGFLVAQFAKGMPSNDVMLRKLML